MTPDTARMSDLHVADGVTGERRQAACAALDAFRVRVEVRRLESRLADLGGPLAVTAADCGSPGRSAEVASSVEVER